ncbi:organic hydroperoxide resistance protein [Bacillus licheniformis]|nr:organic hydroperoxide resistance protein [Bacillus licheniformis]MED4408526.1 organic hydroperoxide resistance protein [Bacillus licheniformis]
MMKPLFTSQATANGGRDGQVTSSDRVLELELAMPGTPKAKENENATNPEQLFAAGYAACFDSALQLTAQKARLRMETEVTANVSLLKDEADGGYKLSVTLQVKGTGVEQRELEKLVHHAHTVCPYSKAISGNVDVNLEVIS